MTDRSARTIANLRPRERETNTETDNVNRCYALIFGTPEGKIVLADLRSLTVDQVVPAEASDGALRMQEGKRQLHRIIEGKISSGRRTPTES